MVKYECVCLAFVKKEYKVAISASIKASTSTSSHNLLVVGRGSNYCQIVVLEVFRSKSSAMITVMDTDWLNPD